MKASILFAFAVVFVASAQPPPSDLQTYLNQLADRDAQETAVRRLAAMDDPKAHAVIQALLDRELHTWESPDGETLLVIPGEADGEGVALLFRAYGKEPLGVSVATRDLDAVRAGRQIRKLGKELIGLKSPVASDRRSAAVFLGRQEDPTLISTLEEAKATEKDRWVRRAINEAIQVIRLADEDAAVRVEAMNALAALHSEYALVKFREALADETEADPEIVAAMHDAVYRLERWRVFVKALQTGWNGLSLASVLALIAVGLGVTFGLMKVINMAHGELMLTGAYTAYMMQRVFVAALPPSLFGAFPILAIPMAFVTAAAMGVVIELLVVRNLYGRPLDTLLATFGVSLVLQQAARHIFGAQNVDIASPPWLSGGWQIVAGVVLPYNRLFILGVSAACILGAYFVLLRSGAGLKIRAVTQNRDMSACLGIPTRKVDRWTFAFGSGLAGIAGCALSQLGNVGPDLGQTYLIDSFMVVVLGGVGKLAGVICGALMIGGGNKILEGLTSSPVIGKVLILVALILFLQKNPLGVFPDRGRDQESS